MATVTKSAAEKILALYRQRTRRSRALADEARQVLPSGIAHDSRHLDPYPIFVERAAGAHKWDVDGNRYVDYTGGHGALLLGHNPALVVKAVEEQLRRGTHFGACHELELRWAQAVCRMVPSAERVRFTSSGTEATMLAMRIARAATGRTKVLRFRGHFHGWHDHAAFAVTSHFDGTPTPGVLPALTSEVALADAGDNVAVARILAQGDVAAAIIEPTGASWGQVPVAPQFVQQLRELTARHGTLLIFDEVISGFRCAPGGAQQALNICPDLTTLAKILAGGLPGGAVAGRRDLLDQLDFAASAQANREKIPHQGTFNANPLSAAAGITTLGIVESTGACAQASDYAARLREELTRVLHDEQSCWVVYGSYSGFHLFTNPDRLPIGAADIESGKVDYRALKRADRTTNNLLRVGMMCHGVEIFGWPGGPTSTAHTNDDLEQTADALRQTIRTLEERA